MIDLGRRIARDMAAPFADEVDAKARFPAEGLGALRKERLLGALVPTEVGGLGRSLDDVAALCDVLGQHCAATAMIFAMHQIQVACLVRHGMGTPALRDYLGDIAEQQLLIASVTSEVGVGGNTRTSVSALLRQGGRYSLTKDATTVSYGEYADDLLITTRRAPDAPPSDQVLVLARKGDFQLEKKGEWDTLGMRGTCSPAMYVTASGSEEQVLPVPFADISGQTMVPVSHILWSSLWLGIATNAVARAAAFTRTEARKKPGTMPPTAMRLAELSNTLQLLRASVHDVANEAGQLMSSGNTHALSSMSFALRMNNLKISSSQLALQIVQQALLICGIHGYKNNTPYSLGRHLRDACSAALMVGNDRIYNTNASLLLVVKDE